MAGASWLLAVCALAGPTLDVAPRRIDSLSDPEVAAFVEAKNEEADVAIYAGDGLSFERWLMGFPREARREPKRRPAPPEPIPTVNGVPWGADLLARRCVELAVAPDGTRAVVGSWVDGRCALQLVDAPDGALRRQELGAVRGAGLRSAEVAWTSDGSHARILTSDRLIDMDLDEVTLRESPAPRGARRVAWADDAGSAIVGWRRDRRMLWLAEGRGWTPVDAGSHVLLRDPWVGEDGGAPLVLRADPDGGTRIVRLDRDEPGIDGARCVVTADGAHRIEGAKRVGDRLIVVRRRDGILRLERTSVTGGEIEGLGVTATEDLAFVGWRGADVVVRGTGIEGEREWRVGATGAPVLLEDEGRAVTVETVYAPAEGVDVPITLVSGPGAAPDAPLWVSVYGGFGVANRVEDDDLMQLWLRAGGRWAAVHVRGGDERGPAWHAAATGVDKVRTVEDLIAAVAHLHARGLGVPARTALWGDSNGGLVAAAAVARRPDLFGAVVAGVGPHDLVDAARLEADPDFSIGTHVSAATTPRPSPVGWWRGPEYPSGPSAAEKAAARALSPVHTVPAGPLPAVFLYTGVVDDVVNPLHSVRLAAAWDDLPGGGPLLRVHDTWTHAPPPGTRWIYRESAWDRARQEGFVFVLRTFGLIPPLPSADPAP